MGPSQTSLDGDVPRACNDSTDVVSYIFNDIEIVQHVNKDCIQATDVTDANVIDVDWF